MDESLAITVRQRAGEQCEYCQLPESWHPGSFEIEHVIPKQHGGSTDLPNLAYACLHCNRHKGPNLAGLERIEPHVRSLRCSIRGDTNGVAIFAGMAHC